MASLKVVYIFPLSFRMTSTVTDNLVIGRSYLSNIGNSDLIPVKAVHTHSGFPQFPPNDDLSMLYLEKTCRARSVWTTLFHILNICRIVYIFHLA